MIFNNLIEITAYFSANQNCIDFIEDLRWKGKPICMYCGNEKLYRLKKAKRFQCPNCHKQFSAIKGTFLERSKVPLHKWLVAMYILSSHKKGISSHQLAKDITVTQTTAWFMLHRLRGGMIKDEQDKLTGTVEIDETYMSRKYGSHYQFISPKESEKIERETIHVKRNKGAVIGMKQRGGQIRLVAATNTKAETIGNAIKKNVSKDAHLMTDESLKYKKSLKEYKRQSVNHSSGEWVKYIGDDIVHNNGVENIWSVMKRGVNGIYHQISAKHLQSYCDEFEFRYNTRFLSDAVRFKRAFENLGNRITYKELTENKEM